MICKVQVLPSLTTDVAYRTGPDLANPVKGYLKPGNIFISDEQYVGADETVWYKNKLDDMWCIFKNQDGINLRIMKRYDLSWEDFNKTMVAKTQLGIIIRSTEDPDHVMELYPGDFVNNLRYTASDDDVEKTVSGVLQEVLVYDDVSAETGSDLKILELVIDASTEGQENIVKIYVDNITGFESDAVDPVDVSVSNINYQLSGELMFSVGFIPVSVFWNGSQVAVAKVNKLVDDVLYTYGISYAQVMASMTDVNILEIYGIGGAYVRRPVSRLNIDTVNPIIPEPIPGTGGKSAYELAVERGFVGTLDEWLASLKGKNGTSLRPRKNWSPNTQYVCDDEYIDIVTNDTITYYCTESHLSGETFDSTKWFEFVKSGSGSIPKITIGENGNWFIDGVDTGCPSTNPDISRRLTYVEEQVENMLYKAISILTFKSSVTIAEMGSTVNSVTLEWTINKEPTKLMLDNQPIDTTLRKTIINNANIKTNKTFTLKAVDDKSAESSRSVSVSFMNGCYYGTSPVTDVDQMDSTFIHGLTKVLSGTKARTITVNAATGEYIFYVLPIRLGTPTFEVGGFTGGFNMVKTFDYTNDSGYTESYAIWKTTNDGLGNTKITIS